MLRLGIKFALLAASALLVAGAAFTPAAHSAAATTFSGRATVLKGQVAGVPIGPVVDTGPVAPTGGELEASLLCYPDRPDCGIGVPDLTNDAVSATVLHAAVVARGNKSRAEATVAEVGLTNVAGNTIRAELLTARAEASCAGGQASVKGKATVAELTINGTTIDLTGEVNQTVPLPSGGAVIINEQVGSAQADRGDITVRALHVVIPALVPGTGATDLIVAEAHADITCATPAQPACPGAKPSFVTGGGYIGAKQHFAVAGRDGEAWGHVMWKPTNLHVKRPFAKTVETIDALDKLLADHPELTFDKSTLPPVFSFDGGALLYWTKDGTSTGAVVGEALALDFGEPGNQPRGWDFFEILGVGGGSSLVSLGAGFLEGGNIQFHDRC